MKTSNVNLLYNNQVALLATTMQHRMKKYYLQGKEISEKQAKAIEAKNQKYISSNDISLWAKCKFITVINK